MAKYDKLRYRSGTAGLDWVGSTITLGVLSGYTFDAAHGSLADVREDGAVLLATTRLTGKSVSVDGYARSTSVLLKVVPAGGPYDLILFADPNGIGPEAVPLVHYNDAVTTTTPGDLLVRPDDLVDGVGQWFRF